VAYQGSFTLRGVPVTGVFDYPVEDETLNQVALVDPDTARALNGYIHGSVEPAEIPEEQRELLDSDMSGMFAGQGDGAEAPGDADGGIDPTSPLASPEAAEDFESASRDARETVEGAWNFLLVSLKDGADPAAVKRRLAEDGYTRTEGYVVRGWRETVGGSAQIVSALQLLFNVGLLFVAFGAAIITTNALVLSVLERTREIGTLRALGASKPRLALMIGLETLFVVVGGAVLGLALGGAGTGVLNESGLTIDNQYVNILFGGEPIRGTVTAGLIGTHLLAAVGLTLVALVYPLRRALKIAPVEAMAE
jgi:hypothetical protein